MSVVLLATLFYGAVMVAIAILIFLEDFLSASSLQHVLCNDNDAGSFN